MKNIGRDPHSFTIQEVIIECKVHNADEPAIVDDTNGVEIPTPILSNSNTMMNMKYVT